MAQMPSEIRQIAIMFRNLMKQCRDPDIRAMCVELKNLGKVVMSFDPSDGPNVQ